MMEGYIQKIRDEKKFNRLALITFEYLVPFYEKFGFKSLGASEATFGGVDWIDMVQTRIIQANKG
jgi:predicted GNAT family N-acyltransferase